MVSNRGLLAVLIVIPVSITLHGFPRKRDTGFLNRTVSMGDAMYRYQVYIPADWSKGKKWPIILFLHGAGERGEDGLVQTQVGIGTAIRRFPERFPSIVVMPQCRKNARWTHPNMESMALKALDETIKEFKGDPNRLYLTGLSMGGYGAWSLASKLPGKFAALAPICGGIRPPPNISLPQESPAPAPVSNPYEAVARTIGKTPVWIFHGGVDSVVPVSESRKMNQALQAAGGDVRYSEYDGVGHNSWDKAYADPDFVPWLLSHHRPVSR